MSATPEELAIYRKLRLPLAITSVLFSAFAWMTAHVEGVNSTVIGLVAVAIVSIGVLLWVTFRWKVATVIAVALAMLVGGLIGVTRDGPAPADAHTIQCGNPPTDPQQKPAYLLCRMTAMQHAIWHAQHDTTVAVARNVRAERKCVMTPRGVQWLVPYLTGEYWIVAAVDCLSRN